MSQSLPSAPEVRAEDVPGSEPDGRRLFVNAIRAVTPSGAGAPSASEIACASAFGAAIGPEPVSAAWAIVAVVTSTAAIAHTAISRLVEMVRSRLMPTLYARSLRDL